ncbi:Vacuolar protease A [Perkinsus olseni]|uniref:Vacuolar protease A n=2 Tax=Perkinsus olseni TaxID=32597 RepID=A0A7J6R5I3_PEROL|nr:Vacuolar protease A [Perkinsus olseni]
MLAAASLLVLSLHLSTGSLPKHVVDFPIKIGDDRALADLTFDEQVVRLVPDTAGFDTFVLYKKAFSETQCQDFAAGCYECPHDSCAAISKTNITVTFADNSSFVYFNFFADLTVKLGNGTEVTVENYDIGVVKDYFPKTMPPSPILGLHREAEFTRQKHSFIHQLVRNSEGAIGKLTFSITYPRTSDEVGHLTAGGNPDPAWYVPFNPLTQNDSSAWTLGIDQVGYRADDKSEPVTIKKGRVLFDSGATVIIGPNDEANKVLSLIAKFVEFKGSDVLKIIDCSDIPKLPEVWFDVQADDDAGTITRLFIQGRDYVLHSGGKCYISITGGDLSAVDLRWMIGAPLFKGYFVQFSYSTYDAAFIGFGKKK